MQDGMDGAMAPVEDMDFSDDLDDVDEETNIKDEKCPVSRPPSAPSSRPAAATPGSRGRVDILTARQLRVALYALCDGLHQASRVFSTDVQLIWSWLKEARRRSRQTAGEQEVHVDGRDRMVAWVLSMREQQLPITESNLFHKASTLKKKGAFSDSFRISYDWAVNFMLRHRLGSQSVSREATLARCWPPSLEAKIKSFRQFTHRVIQANRLSESAVAAMDELCLFVDLRLVQDKSRCSEALELTGSLPLVTVYLTVLANGIMLPALVLAHRHLAEKRLPEFIHLEAGSDSLTVEEALDVWTNKVWLQNVSSPTQPSKSMLVLDRHREHLGDPFLTSISGSGTLPAMIPGGCSFRLQPLEVCLKPVLQRFLLSRWVKFTAGNPEQLEETSPQHLQANVAQLLVDWLVEALTHINTLPQLWRKSFQLTGVLPEQLQEDPEEVQADLIKTLTETLLGPEAWDVSPPELLELEDEEEEEQGREETQEDEDKGVGQEREETEEMTRKGRRNEEGQDIKHRKETKSESKEREDRTEELRKQEEEGKEREGVEKLEEDSEEEGKETEVMRVEMSKERRETRIVIGEEVGDEWKLTVKSKNEGVQDERMDES